MAAIEQMRVQRVPALAAIRALAFDVQGTCVDFYKPILRMGEAANRAKGLDIDWAALSSEWRDLYRTALDQIIAGQRKLARDR
jgi:2-haloacid dehalogenase